MAATPSAPGLVLRRGTKDDVEEVVSLLERAFVDDPFVGWLVGGDGRPHARRRYFELMLSHIALPRGHVDLAELDGRLVGAALWSPPGRWDLGLADSLRVLPIMIEIIGLRRFRGVAAHLETIERARPPEPRWLLTLIGTEPDMQGRGIGRTLLRPILEQCDQDGASAALETSTPANLRFYQRLGFEVRTVLPLDGTLSAWVMERPPVRS